MSELTKELLNLQTILKTLVTVLVVLRCVVVLSNARSNDQPLSAAFEQCKKMIYAGVIAIFIPDYISIISGGDFFAANITGMTLLKYRIILLVQKATEVVTSLAVAITIFNVAKELLLFNSSADENKPIHIEKIKKVLLVGIITVCCSEILSVIFGYFI